MLTGKDGQKLLEFVYNNPNYEVPFRNTLVSLYKLSQWASVDKYEKLAQNEGKRNLDEVIKTFSQAWRKDQFPTINKLHIIESHLVDFIVKHGGWGIYGEQGNLKLKD